MKVIIQHNWTSGLGDLYCACTEYLNFIKPLKDLGYKTELIFCFNGFSGGNKFIGLNEFDTIFNIDSFKLFDKISVRDYPIRDLEINGTKYHHTQYGPTTPGQHWWDTYFDVIPENIVYPNINPQTFLNNRETPLIFPEFNSEVYNRVKEFKKSLPSNHDFIQIRYFDYQTIPDNEFIQDINKIYLIIKNSDKKYHIGSNNQYSNDKFLTLDNVIQYKFNNLNLFSNDHSYYFYNKHISNEMLLDRLYDNLAEMVLISEAKSIFLYTKFSWISNFLFYGISQQKNPSPFTIINNNLNLIYEFNN